MQVIKTKKELQIKINEAKLEGKKIGFVPTMGALHQGHLSLIKRARNENDIVVCSIFVNPVQFNNQEDLKTYPRSLEQDAAFIKPYVDYVFAPEVEEMYPEKPTETFDFETLETVMEGQYRPGHFKGVAVVVSRLFTMVQPNNAYFGEKDFQQLAIIQKMVKMLKMSVNIVPCEIIREQNGLAMSSRNRRLSAKGFEYASLIYKTLSKSKMLKHIKIEEVKQFVIQEIEKDSIFEVEYFEMVDAET